MFELCHSHTKKNVLLKFISIVCMTPRDWMTTLYGSSAPKHVSHCDLLPGWSQEHSVHMIGESWPTDRRQIYWPVAWQTEGSDSSKWGTHWTAVLTIWFICCHALVYSTVCVLITCMRFAIVHWVLLLHCD